MNVNNFLENELTNGTINSESLFTVTFRKKSYLANIKECTDLFGGLLVKKFEKRTGFENGFLLQLV